MIKLIKLDKEEVCSCGSCGGRTYTSKTTPVFKKVKQMYQIKSESERGSGQVISICNECLDELLIQIDDVKLSDVHENDNGLLDGVYVAEFE